MPPQANGPFIVEWFSTFGPTSLSVDDFAFGPAPILPKLPPPPGTENNPPYENQAAGGDPVSTFTGTFSDTHVDVAIPGRGPAIQFARSYNSNDTRASTLGPGWTHSYNIRLVSPGDATEDIILMGPQGRSDRYVHSGGSFAAPAGVHRTLVRNSDDTYTATDKSQSEWRFDPTGNLTQIRDRFGNASNLVYDANGRLSTVSDPAARGVLTFAYTNGRLTSVTDWLSTPRIVAYQYDGSGRLWKVTDRDGMTTTFAYDGTSQRIATITNGRGFVALTLTYDAQGRVATQKDARGLVTGDVTTFAYVVNPDTTRNTTITAPVTSFEPSFTPTMEDTYAASGWLSQRTIRPSSTETLTETFTYDTAGNRTSVTDAGGNRTDVCYDVDFTGQSIPGGAANPTRTIGPAPTTGANRPVTLLRYDAKNNLIQSVAPKGVPSGQVVTCATDLSAIDSVYVADFAYDAGGVNLLSQTRRFTDPDTGLNTAVTKYEYGDSLNPGLVTRTIPPRGNTTPTPDYTYATTFTYFTTGSKAGNLQDVTDPLGNRTSYDYDAVGRVITIVNPLGNAPGGTPGHHATDFSYDREDRLRFHELPAPVDPLAAGLRTETRYDQVGNPTARLDANGQVTTFAYDSRNSLLQVKESAATWTVQADPPPAVITTEYAYDAGGNVTRLTRAKGDASYERAVDYSYDGRGLVRVETQYPSWPSTTGPLVTSYTYDPTGNRLTLLDPLGRTTTSAYDAINRLTGIDYSDPTTPDVGHAYDANGNRTAMTDGTGATTYGYDEADRLLSVTSPGPKTVGYRYDLDGNRTKLIYPDATAVTYAFDKASQLSSLADWASRTVAYTYWADGLVKTATNPDTSVATYAYDNARRLVDILHERSSTLIAHHTYRLDRVGNVVVGTDFVSGLTQPPPWSPQAPVNDVLTSDQLRPAIEIGSDGSVYAAWSDSRGGTSDIYYSRRDPLTGAWSANERVNNVTTGAQTQPTLTIDGLGNVYVAWADARLGATDDDVYASIRTATSGTWSASVRMNDDGAGKRQYDPSIARGTGGHTIVVWYDERGGGSKKHIYSARLFSDGSASVNFKVTSDQNAVKGEPEIVFGADQLAYAVWRDHRSGNADVWFASLPSGSSIWSTNTKISDDPGTAAQGAPHLGIDTAGNILAVWSDDRTSPSQIRARRRPAGTGTWSASVVVGGSVANAPAIAVRPDGRAYASWSDGTPGTLTTIWGSEYDPATLAWSAAERLTETTEEAGDPAVGFTTSQLVVLYQRRPSGGDFDIHVRRKSVAGDEYFYGYDRLYRLTSVAGPDGPRTYAYDPVGNRLTRVSGGATAYTYDRADRIMTAGSTSMTVDANGNLTAKGPDTFAFDQANRMTAATVAGASETYAYDGDATRFSRQVGANPAIRYVSDINRGLPVSIDDGTRKFVYGLGLAYAVSGSSIEVYHADRLGSSRALTNGSGAVIAGYRTDEWGLATATSGGSTQPFGFTGEPRDATGLTYLRSRYYDPDLGRLTSRDTWPGMPTVSMTLNRYAYANGNPVTNTDPSGHFIDTLVDIGFVIYDGLLLVFGPEKDRGVNAAALGADLASLALPFVTGGGVLARGGIKYVDDAGDLIIGKMDDIGNMPRCSVGDHCLNLPPLPKGPARWEQNAEQLQQAINRGERIRDISPDRAGGMLDLERKLLADNGFLFDPASGYWLRP